MLVIPIFRSLAFRVLWLSISLLALPLFVDIFILVQQKHKVLFSSAQVHLVEVNKEKEAPISQALEMRKAVIPLIIHALDLENHFPKEPSAELNRRLSLIADRGDFSSINIVRFNEKGSYTLIGSSRIFSTELSESGIDSILAVQHFFVETNFSKEQFSMIAYDVDIGHYQLLFSVLITSGEHKKPLGFVIFSTDMTDLFRKSLTKTGQPYPVSFAVIRPNRIIIAASDPTLVLQRVGPFTKSEYEKEKDVQQSAMAMPFSYEYGAPYVAFDWKNERQIGSILPGADASFYLLSYASRRDIYERPLQNMLHIYASYALIVLVGGALTALFAWYCARPLQRLAAVMAAIQSGDLSQRYVIDPFGFEINELGLTFNGMLDALLEKKERVETERIKREIYAQELKIGRNVQRSLLPEKMPNYPNVEIAERYLPAKEVAGDFYDLFVRGDNTEKRELVLMIADASDKGVQACFYSLGVRSSARAFAREFDDPAVIMKSANRLFCDDSRDSGMFVTAALAIYDGQERLLRYFSCGHNPILVRRTTGEIVKLANLGIAMGFIKEMQGETRTLQLAPGDLICLYTDGVTEAMNEVDALFGEERLERFLKESGNESVDESARMLLEELKRFCGKKPQHDDITLLLVKVL